MGVIMRIIDKKTDFYDYLQDSTDTIVFDRRQSVELTKELVCKDLRMNYANHTYMLLQCGYQYWLFLLTVTKKDSYDCPKDYSLQLLDTWKNYNAPSALISVKQIRILKYDFDCASPFNRKDGFLEYLNSSVDKLRAFINNNEYRIETSFDQNTIYRDHKGGWTKMTLTIPLLKSSGFSAMINPVDVFYAIEEYFSAKKTASERTEPLGITNDDKISMHGFDTKTSFRGNNKKRNKR